MCCFSQRLFLLTLVVWLAGRPVNAADRSRVDYDREVAPILSRCLRCHGPVGAEAGLDLTSAAAATGELESGTRAIVPAKPEASELLRRIAADDPAERMPPVGPPLSAIEVETLRRWIAEGAAWPPHWAYRPLVRPSLPAPAKDSAGEWSRTRVDAFLWERLAEQNLSPSPLVDRRTWLRRVTWDLTGLPPAPRELDAFLRDDSPAAFERVVDRLLSSPHYGERWARHWMDVVHFAETHGHDQDRPRPNAWPYRDYLIRSFNEDKPYARFIDEQIAGDVLFPDDPQAIVATGFLAAGPWDESSLQGIREDSIDREIGRYLDRDDIVTSVMTTFASASVHCARCHDHKFDPLPQAEYYALQAVFAGIDKADRAYDSDPQVARRRRELLARKSALPELRDRADAALLDPALQARVASWEREIASATSAWITLDPETFSSEKGATLTELADHSLLAGGDRPETDVYVISARVPLPVVAGLRIEVLTDDSLPQKGPGRAENGNLHLNEVTVTASPADDPGGAKPVAVRNPTADFDQEGWTIAMAIDGNPATAWGIHPEEGKPHRASFEFAEPLRCDGETLLTVRLEQTHGRGHVIGRVKLATTASALPLPTEAESLPAPIASALRVPPQERRDAQRAELAAYVLEREIDRELDALPSQSFVYAGTHRFEPIGSFRPAEQPRAVHVLHRGDVVQPLGAAEPGALSCLSGLKSRFSLADAADEGERRAALARWMSGRENVLVWRSIANRVWQSHFGRGLVETPNDFGRMGSGPSHRELLDWLAVELIESGGSLKHLHRPIVLSAAYRQSSGHVADGAARDADNRLLWRMNRQRLDAESVRDAALAFSGELDVKMGGPSVKQFVETPGIHVTPNVDYRSFDPDDPANRRRSVYRFHFRTLPDPFLETLDCPDGSQSVGRRSESVTALQALAMLHDPFLVRRSEHLADRLQREQPDLPAQVGRLFDLVLLRAPTTEELEEFTTYASGHGLANACRMLLNSNEFLYLD